MDDFVTFRGEFDKKKSASDKRYKDNSKKRLLASLKKKFDTTIIGALAAFEERFGELWGHGLRDEDLDEEQREWKELWMEARARILDNGNSNLRAAQSEISQYTLSWNRYVNKFDFKDSKEQ